MADFWTEVHSDAPVLEFHFAAPSGGFTDFSGGGHGGTVVGTVGYQAAGPNGVLIYSADFGGGYVSVPNTPDLNLADGPFSIMVLFKRKSASGASEYLFGKTTSGIVGGSPPGPGYAGQLVEAGASDQFRFQDGYTSTHLFNASGSINDTNWHLIHMTHDAATHTGKLYLDGSDVTDNSTLTFSDNTAPLIIGDLYAGFSGISAYYMAGFAIFKSVLSPTRVSVHNANLATAPAGGPAGSGMPYAGGGFYP